MERNTDAILRLGTTDTQGTKSDKQEATGHRSEAMLQIYDKSIPVVKPALDWAIFGFILRTFLRKSPKFIM